MENRFNIIKCSNEHLDKDGEYLLNNFNNNLYTIISYDSNVCLVRKEMLDKLLEHIELLENMLKRLP